MLRSAIAWIPITFTYATVTRSRDIWSMDLNTVNHSGMLYFKTYCRHLVGPNRIDDAIHRLNDAEVEVRLKKLRRADIENIVGISFCGHNITKIPFNLAKKFPNIKELHLGNSVCLTKIDSKGLRTLPGLSDILIKDANIETIESAAFEGLSNLKELWITDNRTKLTICSNSFTRLPNLKKLYLPNNKIETIGANTFEGLSSLAVLSLSQNKIKNIDGDAFKGLSGLRKLYLDDNKIERIDTNALKSLPNLEELYISKNQLDVATINELKEKLPKLHIIDIIEVDSM